MKKPLLIHGAIILILSLALFAAGWITRNQMTDLVTNESDFSQFVVEYGHDQVIYEGENEYLSDLYGELDQADIVIRAVYNGEREPMYQSTLSRITVTQIIKGDAVLVGQDIAVYEENFFSAYLNQGIYRNFFPTNLMIEGREYYLFLSEKASARPNPWNLDEYAPAASTYLYLFPADLQDDDVLVINEDDVEGRRVLFGSVMDYPYVVTSELASQQIKFIYSQVMGRYELE